MFRKVMMLALAAGALAALMAPAGASATWTKDHQALQENAQIELTGQAAIHGEVGSIECQVRSLMQLTAGTTTAVVTESGVDLKEAGSTVTSKCSISGGLESFGCTDVASSTAAGLPWTAHAVSTQTISTTTGTVQNHLHGGIFCPKTVQATPGTVLSHLTTQNTWTTGTSSGTLQIHLSNGGSQEVQVTGHGSVGGGGKYGVA